MIVVSEKQNNKDCRCSEWPDVVPRRRRWPRRRDRPRSTTRVPSSSTSVGRHCRHVPTVDHCRTLCRRSTRPNDVSFVSYTCSSSTLTIRQQNAATDAAMSNVDQERRRGDDFVAKHSSFYLLWAVCTTSQRWPSCT